MPVLAVEPKGLVSPSEYVKLRLEEVAKRLPEALESNPAAKEWLDDRKYRGDVSTAQVQRRAATQQGVEAALEARRPVHFAIALATNVTVKVRLDIDVTVEGLGGPLCRFRALITDRVRDVKARIFRETAIPMEEQRLVCSSAEPDGSELLAALFPGEHVAYLSLLRRQPSPSSRYTETMPFVEKLLEAEVEFWMSRQKLLEVEVKIQTELEAEVEFWFRELQHEAEVETQRWALHVELSERRRVATMRLGMARRQKHQQAGHRGLGCRKQ